MSEAHKGGGSADRILPFYNSTQMYIISIRLNSALKTEKGGGKPQSALGVGVGVGGEGGIRRAWDTVAYQNTIGSVVLASTEQ